MEQYIEDGILGWDDEISEDGGGQYVLLEEGDYNFTVTGFERGRFTGSAKTPACNKAVLTLTVDTAEGQASCKYDLILYKSLEWKLSAFFRAIGQKRPGESLRMDWSKVEGSQGRAHFAPRSYTGKDGKEHQCNDVQRFYDYDANDHVGEVPLYTPAEKPKKKAAPAQTSTGSASWKNGNF